MKTNPVKAKLASGVPVLGTWSIINSPVVTDIVASAGLDFQILDLEHGTFDLGTLEASIRACESNGCSPLVRVPGATPSVIQNCLDFGAHGIVVPQVRDAKSAADAVAATLYAPEGIRGFNPFTRAGGYTGKLSEQTPKLKNGFGLTSIIIENRDSYAALDQILAISGLDMVYLGVYDMSVALGVPGNLAHPSVVEFLESSVPLIRKAGKAAGLMVKDQAEMKKFHALGANFFLFGVDSFVIHRAFEKAVAEFKEVTGK